MVKTHLTREHPSTFACALVHSRMRTETQALLSDLAIEKMHSIYCSFRDEDLVRVFLMGNEIRNSDDQKFTVQNSFVLQLTARARHGFSSLPSSPRCPSNYSSPFSLTPCSLIYLSNLSSLSGKFFPVRLLGFGKSGDSSPSPRGRTGFALLAYSQPPWSPELVIDRY